jgi:tRNA A-37 threonylcarbamoyl transferase component Bud32
MDDDRLIRFSRALSLSFDALTPIHKNAYCEIFRAEAGQTPCILKHYFGNDPTLMLAEGKALDFYHSVAVDHPDLIDSGTVARSREENLICIGFVEGERMSDLIYHARRDPVAQERTIRIMSALGKFLRLVYERTADAQRETAPFLFEYMIHCSNRLARIPGLGHLWFRSYPESATRLIKQLKAVSMPSSFAHGDLVFRNIHVHDERLGLIDFANSHFASHTLNDLYNLYFALANMLLPHAYRKRLWSAFSQELSGLSFPDAGRRFYHEYHRRRWLMLKLTGGRPRDFLQALRGMATFAREGRGL